MSIESVESTLLDWLPSGGIFLLLVFSIGLGWIIKNCTPIPNKYIPLILSFNCTFVYPLLLWCKGDKFSFVVGALQGFCIGFGASGIYNFIKDLTLDTIVLGLIKRMFGIDVKKTLVDTSKDEKANPPVIPPPTN